jgi:hypothetical protein
MLAFFSHGKKAPDATDQGLFAWAGRVVKLLPFLT